MGSKSKTHPADTVQSPKKKHSKFTSSADSVVPDTTSSKKKKHSKSKDFPDSDFVEPSKKTKKEAVNTVFQKAAQEEAAVSKKKKKSVVPQEEALDQSTAFKSPKKSSKPEEFVIEIDDLAKSPSKKRSRPDKEIESLQSPKKKHKKVEDAVDDGGKDSDSPPEGAEHMKVEKKKAGMIDLWPTEDMQNLFNRIRSAIPADDKLVFKTRQENIDWNSVAFGSYSGEDCKSKWLLVVKQLRGFRLLSELVDDAVVWMEKPWTKYSKKDSKQLHPDMPHKPLTTYMIYYMENKERVKAENPGINMTTLSTLIAKEYKALSEKGKKRYEELAAIKKKEYQEQMEIFERKHPEMQSHKNAPKKSRTPSQIFIDDRLKKYENTGTNLAPVKEDAREKFKSLPDKKRLKWIKKALEEHKIYMEQLKCYMDSHPDFKPVKKTAILNRQELQLLLKEAGKPAEPPRAAHQLYMREEYSEEVAKGTPPEEIFRVINSRWKDLPAEEQQRYKNRCLEERKQYNKAFAAYLESLDDEHREIEEFIASKTIKSIKKKKNKEDEGEDENPEPKKKVVFKGEPQKPPSSPFELFVQGIKKSTGVSIRNVHGLWDSLPEKDKQKFCVRHANVVEKYKKKMALFLKSLGKEKLAEYTRYRGRETSTGDNDAEQNLQKSSVGKLKEADSSNDSESDSEDEVGLKAGPGSESDSSSESEKEDAKVSSESEEEQEERITNNVEIHKPPASSSSDSDSE